MKNIYHNDTKWGKEEFKKELRKGYKYQTIVRDKLIEAGLNIEMPELQEKQSDDGDIYINIKGKEYIIEVKSQSLEFTSIENFPFDSVIVDMEENWNKKKYTPTAYIHISQKTNYMFVVPCSTQEFWTRKFIKDKVRGYSKWFMFVDKKYIKEFGDLVQWLKEKEKN